MHLVYLATFQLFGFRAAGFHLVNLLLHAANTALAFLVASRLVSTLGFTGLRHDTAGPRPERSIPRNCVPSV